MTEHDGDGADCRAGGIEDGGGEARLAEHCFVVFGGDAGAVHRREVLA